MRVFIIRHCPSHKKIYWKIIAWFQHFLKEDCYFNFPSSDNVIFILLLYANLVIVPSYQTMSITSAKIRKGTYISTLPTVIYWNNSEFTGNLSFICHNTCLRLIFHFLKIFSVFQDIDLWNEWEVGSNPNSAAY